MNKPTLSSDQQTINNTEKQNLLIIEDDGITLVILELTFNKTFTVHTASTPENGIQIIENLPPKSLVLSDIENDHSPLNGLDIARKTFQTRVEKAISMFIMSGRIEKYKTDLEILKTQKIISDYVQKPFDHRTLTKIFTKTAP